LRGNAPLSLRAGTIAALLAAVLVSMAGCGGKSSEVLSGSAQGDEKLVALGNDALQREKWEEARGYFQQLLDAYRDFLTFFPNHPRADYAQFQIGYGHYRQIHSPDRDQDPTALAIEEFEKLVELYRNSRYAEEGQKLLEECYETLAESEFRVGLFYLEIRKACRAAIARFNQVIEKFPAYKRQDELHFRLGSAYQMCGQLDEALPHFQRVVDNYPESEFRDEAQAILATLQLANGTGQLK